MKAALLLFSGVLVCGLLAGTVQAQTQPPLTGEWRKEVGITLGAFVSDNICQDNDDRTAWGAGTVTPDIYIQGRGARTNLFLQGAVEYNSLAHGSIDCASGRTSNLGGLTPQLRYLGDFELIEDWLTLESNAFIGTNPFDPFAVVGFDTSNERDNVNVTFRLGAGAVLEHRLLDSLNLRLRVHHNEQRNRMTLLSDSSENRAQFNLGTDQDRWISLGVAARYSEVEHRGSDRYPPFENTLASAEVRGALRFGPHLQINGLAGEERNEFLSVRPEIEGAYWDAGLRWTPNERVEVTLGTGERFFGRTPRASISYRHRRSLLSASYAYSLIFPRDLRSASLDSAIPGADLGSNLDFGLLPGDPVGLIGDPTFISDTPVINERLVVRYRFSARRTTFTLTGSNSHQVRAEDLAEATFTDLWAMFSRQLSATLSADLRLGWRERENDGNNPDFIGQYSRTWRAGFGFSRELGSNTSLRIGYQYTRQDSDVASIQYNENRVTVSARHQF